MKKLIPIGEEYEVEVVHTLEECVLKFNNGTSARNEAIYEAYKLGEDEFKKFSEIVEVNHATISKAVSYGLAKEELSFQISGNLNETKSIDLEFGVFSCLKGKTTEEIETNFQEIYKALGSRDTPKSYEIEVYNALKSSASNGEQLRMVKPIFNAIVNGSSSLKRKFRHAPKPFKLKKLLTAIENNSDESILISIADTGNSIPTISSKADKELIKKLQTEIEELKQDLFFFKNSLILTNMKSIITQMKYAVLGYKKLKGDKTLIKALALLGVEATVSLVELKKAYREKVNIAHPDKGGNAELFQDITKANKLLKNHITRITHG